MAARIDFAYLRAACAAAGPEHLVIYDRLVEQRQEIDECMRRVHEHNLHFEEVYRRLEEYEQRLAALDAALETAHAEYAALQEEYEALELAHNDLHAAYVTVKRQLVLARSRN